MNEKPWRKSFVLTEKPCVPIKGRKAGRPISYLRGARRTASVWSKNCGGKEQWEHGDSRTAGADADQRPDYYDRCHGNAESDSGKDSRKTGRVCAGIEKKPGRVY